MFNTVCRLFSLLLLLAAVSCKKEDLPRLDINRSELELYYDDRFQFTVKQGDQTLPAESIQWTSTEEMTGTIDPDGMLRAGIIGRTTVTGVYHGQTVLCSVTVKPRYDLLREPLAIMGSTMQQVQEYETRKNDGHFSPDRLDYYDYTTDILYISYLFDDDKLNSVSLSYRETPELHEELINFYKERYVCEHAGYSTVIFADRDKTIHVEVEVNAIQSHSISVLYRPYYPSFLY